MAKKKITNEKQARDRIAKAISQPMQKSIYKSSELSIDVNPVELISDQFKSLSASNQLIVMNECITIFKDQQQRSFETLREQIRGIEEFDKQFSTIINQSK